MNFHLIIGRYEPYTGITPARKGTKAASELLIRPLGIKIGPGMWDIPSPIPIK